MLKNNYKIISIVLLLAVTFVSCGEKHKASSLAESFLKENLVNTELSNFEVLRLDSTFKLNEAAIVNMRKAADKNSLYKKNIKYLPFKGEKIVYIRAKYTLKPEYKVELDVTQTFYFNKSITGVIAFKDL